MSQQLNSLISDLGKFIETHPDVYFTEPSNNSLSKTLHKLKAYRAASILTLDNYKTELPKLQMPYQLTKELNKLELDEPHTDYLVSGSYLDDNEIHEFIVQDWLVWRLIDKLLYATSYSAEPKVLFVSDFIYYDFIFTNFARILPPQLGELSEETMCFKLCAELGGGEIHFQDRCAFDSYKDQHTLQNYDYVAFLLDNFQLPFERYLYSEFKNLNIFRYQFAIHSSNLEMLSKDYSPILIAKKEEGTAKIYKRVQNFECNSYSTYSPPKEPKALTVNQKFCNTKLFQNLKTYVNKQC